MNNEIITNEEVMEVTEEIVTANSGRGLKVAAGVGIAVLVGGLAYKYIVKPMIAKSKESKEMLNDEFVAEESAEYDNDSEEIE